MRRPADLPASIAIELRDGTRVEVRAAEPAREPGEPPRPESVPREAIWNGREWHTSMRADNARDLLEFEPVAVRSIPEPAFTAGAPYVLASCGAGRHRRAPGAASPRERGSRRESRAGPGDDDGESEPELAGRRLQHAAAAILKHSRSRGQARSVLWTLAVHASEGEGWRCAPGKTALAAEAGCSIGTVKVGLRKLADLGEVERIGEVEHGGPAIWKLTLPGLER